MLNERFQGFPNSHIFLLFLCLAMRCCGLALDFKFGNCGNIRMCEPSSLNDKFYFRPGPRYKRTLHWILDAKRCIMCMYLNTVILVPCRELNAPLRQFFKYLIQRVLCNEALYLVLYTYKAGLSNPRPASLFLRSTTQIRTNNYFFKKKLTWKKSKLFDAS